MRNREDFIKKRVPRYKKELTDILRVTNMGRTCSLKERCNATVELERIRAERKQKMCELQEKEQVLADLRTDHECLKT